MTHDQKVNALVTNTKMDLAHTLIDFIDEVGDLGRQVDKAVELLDRWVSCDTLTKPDRRLLMMATLAYIEANREPTTEELLLF